MYTRIMLAIIYLYSFWGNLCVLPTLPTFNSACCFRIIFFLYYFFQFPTVVVYIFGTNFLSASYGEFLWQLREKQLSTPAQKKKIWKKLLKKSRQKNEKIPFESARAHSLKQHFPSLPLVWVLCGFSVLVLEHFPGDNALPASKRLQGSWT